MLRGKKKGREYRLGDQVLVVVAKVDRAKGRVDFSVPMTKRQKVDSSIEHCAKGLLHLRI